MTDQEFTCRTCLNTREWHEVHRPRHPFNTGQSGATDFLKPKKEKPQPEIRQSAMPIDPVLRVALINKGVITPQDLRDAEAVIQAATGQFEATVRESRNGESTEETRGRQVQE